MACDARIKVRSDPGLLQAVRGLIDCYLDSRGYNDGESRENVVQAVDEACTNAIRHAYHGDCNQFIEIRLKSDGEWIEVVVCDWGEQADPAQFQQDRRSDGDESGGLGVQFLYKVFDQVYFQPGSKCGNCVIMRLAQPPAVQAPDED